MRTRATCGMISALALAVWLPATAGEAGNDGNRPGPGSKSGSGWNPVIECTTLPGDTWDDLMECLADGIESGPDDPSTDGREDFTVTRLGSAFGIQILYKDGREIDRLWWWENDPNIQMTFIKVDRPQLVGRIGEFVEEPSRDGGTISLKLNDHDPLVIQTALNNKAWKLTGALIAAIRDLGFHVTGQDGYVYVMGNLQTGETVRRMEFASTDPDIVSSDLALLPLDETPLAAASPVAPD